MRNQITLISALLSGFIAFTVQSVATADVTIIPNTETSVFGMDRDAPFRDRLECAQPIPQQIRENLSPSTQDNRTNLEREPGWNFPSGELKAPNISALVQIPLARTVAHPLVPNLESPVKNEGATEVLDLAGDPPPHLRLTHPRPNGLC